LPVAVTSTGAKRPARHQGTVITTAWTVKENANGTVTLDISPAAMPKGSALFVTGGPINATTAPPSSVLAATPSC
jgi:hypothetical protein